MGEQRPGLRDEYPRLTGIGVATGLGGLWGAACYGVLWEGVPFAVDRRFVESPFGTLALLPVRIVLWSIRLVEQRVAGRSFDLSRNFGWIGLVASVVGALLAVGAFLCVRTLARRLRA